MSLKGDVCDLGGVVVSFSFERAFRRWGHTAGMAAAEVGRRFRADELYEAFEVAAITSAEYFDHLRELLGVALSDAELEEGWNHIYVEINMDVLHLLREVRRTGLTVVGLTNANELHRAAWTARYGALLAPSFDRIYTSMELAARKPDVRMFERLLAAQRLRPADVVFFDDIPEHVEAARSLGIPGHIFTDVTAMRADLVRHRVLPRGGD